MDLLELDVVIRDNKPGRYLSIFDLEEASKLLGMAPKTEYFITLQRPDSVACNHYHKIKCELMVCIAGHVELRCEDTATRKERIFDLQPDVRGYKCIRIPPLFAHALRNLSPGESVVRVITNDPPRIGRDDYGHIIFPEPRW